MQCPFRMSQNNQLLCFYYKLAGFQILNLPNPYFETSYRDIAFLQKDHIYPTLNLLVSVLLCHVLLYYIEKASAKFS